MNLGLRAAHWYRENYSRARKITYHCLSSLTSSLVNLKGFSDQYLILVNS